MYSFFASEIKKPEAIDAFHLEVIVLLLDKKCCIELQTVEGLLADLSSFYVAALKQSSVDKMVVAVQSIATCSVNFSAGFTRILC